MGGYLPRVWWMDKEWARIQGGAEIVTPAELKRMKKEKEDVSNVGRARIRRDASTS